MLNNQYVSALGLFVLAINIDRPGIDINASFYNLNVLIYVLFLIILY